MIIENKVIPMIGKEQIHPDKLDNILFERLLTVSDESKKLKDKQIENKLFEYLSLNKHFEVIKMPPAKLFIDQKLYDQNLTPKYYQYQLNYKKALRRR